MGGVGPVVVRVVGLVAAVAGMVLGAVSYRPLRAAMLVMHGRVAALEPLLVAEAAVAAEIVLVLLAHGRAHAAAALERPPARRTRLVTVGIRREAPLVVALCRRAKRALGGAGPRKAGCTA